FQNGVTLGSRTLKLGSSGDDVDLVQRWHGITADGYFGPQTEAKVKATQQRNKLVVDGIVGQATWAVMGVGKPPA
ncbi:peptidoglycan-binding domain-containing protein, partial [Salmonella enterica]|uniref:peptidoglycan-binding domain-containing protein n=1 Tax=Salmonella enterica TaxID=28901 RepID=UPI00329782E6